MLRKFLANKKIRDYSGILYFKSEGLPLLKKKSPDQVRRFATLPLPPSLQLFFTISTMLCAHIAPNKKSLYVMISIYLKIGEHSWVFLRSRASNVPEGLKHIHS